MKKWKNIIKKSNLFDIKFYLFAYPDVRGADIEPIEHFITYGTLESRNPSNEFNTSFYLEHYSDVRASGINPLVHYILHGKEEGRFKNNDEQNIQIIEESNLFDEDYYLSSYPDIRETDIHPLEHFVKNGANEGRKPNAYFEAKLYINVNQDIQKLTKEKGLVYAFLHFIQFGCQEIFIGKRPLYIKNHRFNEKTYYLENIDINKSVDNGLITSFEHYIQFGCKEMLEGKRFCESINTAYEIRKFKQEFLSEVVNPNKLNIADLKNIAVPEYNDIKVSIIIPAYNQAVYTYNAINSIIKSMPEYSYEIIVMDDNSTQIEARELNKKVENIKLVVNKENLGFLKNCNKGATHAKGKHILFLNNDVYVLKNWLDKLVDLIESNNNIGMVGSKLVYPDGRLQEAGGIIWNDASGWNYGRLDAPTKPEYNYVKEVDYISGASIMIKKDLWQEIGGFDELYSPAYYEDTDLAFKVRKHGQKVLFQPKSVLVHFEGISNGTDVSCGTKKYQVINNKKFYNKWKDVLKKDNFENSKNLFLARDKSQYKKHILIIDHYIPEFDKDAGSRTMYQYLLEFIELGFHVTFVPDNFYAIQPYTSQLESFGIEVLYGVSIAHQGFEEWYVNNIKYIDIIYLLRPHITTKHIGTIKKHNKHAKIIYNGVDFHYLRLEREYELKLDEQILIEAKKYKNIEFEIFNTVDMVVTISEHEKDVFEIEFPNKNISVIPTYIYNKSFPLSKNSSFKNRKDILFVGGFTHSPNKDGILWFVYNEWQKIKSKNPDIQLNIVGSNAPEEILKLEKDLQINILGFISDDELNKLYDSTRIVIAPLTYGAGVKGKVIESIAQGIPIVTTEIASEGILCKTNTDTYIVKNATSKSSFAEQVLELYSNEREWLSMREQQIKYSNSHFSQYAAKNIIKKIFKGI